MRTAFALPVLAFACAATAPPPPTSGKAPANARRDRFARIANDAHARWSATGPNIADGDYSPPGQVLQFAPVPVLAELPDAVQVALDDGDVHAVLWIERRSLVRVALLTAPVAAAPDARPGEHAVELQRGGVVIAGELRGGRRHVTSGRKTVQFDGWVDDTALGDVFYRDPNEPGTSEMIDAHLAADTPVVAAPGGPPIAILHDANVLRTAEPATAGYVAIAWTSIGITLRGLVAAAAVTRLPEAVRQYDLDDIGGGVGGVTDTSDATLAAGAFFYDKPGGAPVGQVKRAVEIFGGDVGSHTGWSRASIPMPQLGLVHAFVRTTDLAVGFRDSGGNG